MKKFSPIIFVVLAGLCAMGAVPGEPGSEPVPGGSCPTHINECNNSTTCDFLLRRTKTTWLGQTKCTWGTEGCENNIMRPCKRVENYQGVPCRGELLRTVTLDEGACR